VQFKEGIIEKQKKENKQMREKLEGKRSKLKYYSE
jgi:hypothetical protein